MAAIAMTTITGCEKEDLSEEVTETQVVPAESCWFEITVTVTGGRWFVSKFPDWIDLNPDRGSEGATTVTFCSSSRSRRAFFRSRTFTFSRSSSSSWSSVLPIGCSVLFCQSKVPNLLIY